MSVNSESVMRSEKDLFDIQRQAISFGLEGADMLLLAPIGYGKTAIAWTIAEKRIRAGLIDRVIIFAPMRVARLVWPDERREWEHLHDLRVAVAAGEPAKKRFRAFDSDAHVITMNYEQMPWFVDHFGKRKKNRAPLQDVGERVMLLLDEVDKMKTPGSKRFRRMRGVLPFFKARLGMTGTPTPNHLHEIWGQAFMVAEKECGLGTSYTKFKETYFYTQPYSFNVEPHVFAEKEIYEAIAPYTYRIGDDNDELELREHDIFVDLDSDHRAAYDQMEKELIAMLDDWDDPVIARSAGAMTQKVVQMASGFAYYEGGPDPYNLDETEESPPPVAPTVQRQTRLLSLAKMQALEDLISELQGAQLLVVYNYNETKNQLQERFPRMQFLGKGEEGDATVEAWNKGEVELLAIHPASAGHGLNLQKSNAHHICYLTLPWSGGLYNQTNGRLLRRGQEKTVYCHRILARGTIDERIVEVLKDKQEGNKALLAAMKKYTDGRKAD